MRKELNDCCFIYTLKQTGKFSEDKLNLMRLRIKTRYLSQGNIKKICDEFMIKIFISKINENPECKDKKRKILNNGHNFIGCEDEFIPINYATASILSTTLYDKVMNEDCPLHQSVYI